MLIGEDFDIGLCGDQSSRLHVPGAQHIKHLSTSSNTKLFTKETFAHLSTIAH